MAPFWLYRTGYNCLLSGYTHCIFSETWITADPPTSNVDTRIACLTAAARLSNIFGGFSAESRPWSSHFWEQIWPKPNVQEIPINVEGWLANSAAPEACFRLQRVGATGRVGQIRLPILDDTTFTDRPHRRRIDVGTYRPLMNANLGTWPQTFVYLTRTFFNVIFDRRSFTWDNVDHYELRESTSRQWQRLKIFDPARLAAARTWHLPEPAY